MGSLRTGPAWTVLVVGSLWAAVAPGCFSSGHHNNGGAGTGGTTTIACDTTDDCAGTLVCATTVHRCVECVTARDCGGTDSCVDYRCEGPGAGGASSGGNAGNGATGGGAGTSGNGGTTVAGATGSAGDPGSSGASNAGASAGGAGGAGTGCGAVIDDLEDTDGTVCLGSGRQGEWFAWSYGGAASVTPTGTGFDAALLSPARGTSQYGMHIVATTVLAAGIGVPFNSSMPDWNETFDASAYTGVRFFAKADSPLATVDVELHTYAAELTTFGGSCPSACVPNSTPISLTTSWAEFTIPFTDFTGGSAGLDEATTFNLQLVVRTVASFGLWVDDPSFY